MACYGLRMVTTGGLQACVVDELRAELAAQRTTLRRLVTGRTDLVYGTVARYLSGQRDMPLGVYIDICDALGVSPREIMRRAEIRLHRVEGAASGAPAPIPFDASKLPPVVGRQHLAELDAVAEDQYTMPSLDDVTP